MVSISSNGVGQAWRCPECPAEIRSIEEATNHAKEESLDGRPGHIPILLAVVTDETTDGDE